MASGKQQFSLSGSEAGSGECRDAGFPRRRGRLYSPMLFLSHSDASRIVEERLEGQVELAAYGRFTCS